MSDYIISCCSTADLSAEHFAAIDVHYVCFHYFLNDVEYPDDLGKSMPFAEFYDAMVKGANTRTAQVNTNEYLEHFEKFLEQGRDIIHVCLSSGISGSFNSANVAADILRQKYPQRKIYVVDSLGASSGYGLLMDAMAAKRAEGMDIDALYAWVEQNKLHLHHWFFSTDLSFYVKGGRVSKVSGFVGGLLNICPLLNMNDLGQLIPREKIRHKKKVIRSLVEKMAEHAQNGLDYSGKCYISHSDCYDDARAVADLVEERFPNLAGPVEINYVGTTIGSHTGPGTVALFFWGDERER